MNRRLFRHLTDSTFFQNLYALVKAGRTSSQELLSLLSAFKEEEDYAVWSSIDSGLFRLAVVLSNTDYLKMFQSYGRQLLSTIHQKMGWTARPGEKHTDSLLRSLVINRLASFNDWNVLQKGRLLFDNHVAKKDLIPADLRYAVYSCVISNPDEKVLNSLIQVSICL